MSDGMFIGMLHNAALLLAMAYLYDLVIVGRRTWTGWQREIVMGIGLSVVGIGVMATRWELYDGVVLDTRSVLLAVSGLFFGAVPTIIAMAATAAYRIIEGGAGTTTGVVVIVVSGGIGLAWRQWRGLRLRTITWREAYTFGLVVHVAMLSVFAIIPPGGTHDALRRIALPVMVIYPITLAMLAKLLASRFEHEEISEQIEESESRYRALYENHHTVMLIVDPANGDIVDANPGACDYYGWDRDRLRSIRLGDLDTRPSTEVAAEMDEALRQHHNTFMSRHRRADGSTADVEIHSSPIRLAGRELLYSLVHDVSDRIRAEEGIRHLTQAVEQSPTSIVITDLDGGIRYVNRGFTNATGYTLDEVLGENPRILQSGTTAPTTYRELWAHVTSGTEWHGELQNKTKDGRLFWERVVISPVLDASGATTGYLAVKEDITNQRRLEDELRQAQKMEAVGRLAGGVAHDFNNMLQAILGHTELALEDVEDGSPIQESLEEIREAAMRSARLTTQLLAFARRQPVQLQRVDLGEAISAMTSMLRRLIGEDIQLDWMAPDELWPIRIDPSQVDQVLANLAVNARDAMPDGGRLTITAVNEVVTEDASTPATGFEPDSDATVTPPGGYVTLRVTDTGSGIDDEVMTHLFEPFYTTKPAGRGTGLGLATVHGIVSQNGGTVVARSMPGSGTTFVLRFPRSTERASPAEATAPPTPRGGNESVLLVEDEPAIAAVAATALRRDGYTVTVAGDADAAMGHADDSDCPIDLLITDVVMPGTGGRELAERMRRRRPGIRVLFVSGYPVDVITQHGVLPDGIEFLGKPFSTLQLATRVRQVLDA